MERLEGINLEHRDQLCAAGYDLNEVARRGADLYMQMVFINGFFHADPHPGNILLMEGNVIGLLDFGMVGRLSPEVQEDVEEMVMAVAEGDPVRLCSVITRVGEVPAQLDTASLSVDVTDFVSYYASQRMDDFNLSGALEELTELIRRYQIMLPPQIGMLIKVFVMLEGTARLLSPQFNLIEVIQPYQRRMIMRRLSPARHIRKFRRIYSEFEHLLEMLPRGLMEILLQVQSGKFDVHLDHRGLEPSVNRLVLGMLTSALFLGSSLMLANRVPPNFRDVSIVGVIGCALSAALGVRLLIAINKSGALDRKRQQQ